MIQALVPLVREIYRSSAFIPLHAPTFGGQERAYLVETIDSTFVSSVGAFVDRFEQEMASYTGSPRAVATVNGTAALHMCLQLAGVGVGDLVITQPLTFIASCNAILYCQAEPVFVDVDRQGMSLSPEAMSAWLEQHAEIDAAGVCREQTTGRAIRACMPMHTFGHPARLDELKRLCSQWHLALVEDAAESLGSRYHGQHTGTVGQSGALSFNGNKIITTGGGGMILTDEATGRRAKHLTTTAKVPHPYEFVHDELGYNYRLPNLNAALGCAQLAQLSDFLSRKRALADRYRAALAGSSLQFIDEPAGCESNFWLNGVVCSNRDERDALLAHTNENGVMTRPIWRLMNQLPLYAHCLRGDLTNAEWLESRVVNLPSSVPPRP